MYCCNCGFQIPDTAESCTRCGRHVLPAGPIVQRKRLVRPRQGRKVAGVCLAVAQYFELDVAIVRVIWFITAFFGLLGIVAYVAGWVAIPEEPLALPATTPEPSGVPNI